MTKIDGRTREGRALREAEAPARSREATEPARRRRRTDNTDTYRRKLAVNHLNLDHEAYEYRFVVDRDNRLYNMTKLDDWDVVAQDGGEVKEDSTDMGAGVSVVSGTKKDGSPERLYLCRKPKEWAVEDRAAKERVRAERDEQIRTLALSGSDAAKDGAFFNPNGRNTVERR